MKTVHVETCQHFTGHACLVMFSCKKMLSRNSRRSYLVPHKTVSKVWKLLQKISLSPNKLNSEKIKFWITKMMLHRTLKIQLRKKKTINFFNELTNRHPFRRSNRALASLLQGHSQPKWHLSRYLRSKRTKISLSMEQFDHKIGKNINLCGGIENTDRRLHEHNLQKETHRDEIERVHSQIRHNFNHFILRKKLQLYH